MPTAFLRVIVRDNALYYAFGEAGLLSSSSAADVSGPSMVRLGEWAKDAADFWSSFDARRLDSSFEHAARFVDMVFSGAAWALKAELRRFALAAPKTTLAVMLDEDSGALHALEWELIPLGLGLRGLLVVHAKFAEPSTSRPRAGSPFALPSDSDGLDDEEVWRGGRPWRGDGAAGAKGGLLVIGSARCEQGSFTGIERELGELPKRFMAEALIEPDELLLAKALVTNPPSSLHVTLPCVSEDPDGKLVFTFSGAAGVEPQIAVASFASLLARSTKPPSLIVLNARCSERAARLVSRETGATVIGWRGAIDEQDAADFAFFFYARIAEGASPVGAVRAYLARPGERAAASIPVIYVDAPPVEVEQDVEPLRSGAEGLRGARLSVGDLSGGVLIDPGAPVSIDVEIQPVLNPALLKNGVPTLVRLSIDTRNPIQDALLLISCDAGFNVSVYREQRSLQRGAQPIDTMGAHFPNLYELSDKDAGRRQINFTISVQSEGRTLAEVTRSTVWMDRREWLDHKDTWAYIPAFVMPRSEKVQEIMKSAGERLTGIKMWGYQSGSVDDVREQMKAVLRALQELRIVYTNPLGSPIYLPGVRRWSGQMVRDPDQILHDRRGTCHDLALLLASCAENVQIRPLVVLMRGHTFFGFWTSVEAYTLFWKPRSSSAFGDGWLIRRSSDLKTLLTQNNVEFVEATYAADGNKDYSQACSRGAEIANALTDLTFDVAVDIWASRRYIQPV